MRRLQVQILVIIACVGAAYGLLEPQRAQACGRWRNCGCGYGGGGLGWCGSSWGGACFSGGCGFDRIRCRGRWNSRCGCGGYAYGGGCGSSCGSGCGYDGGYAGAGYGYGGGGCGCGAGGGAGGYGGGVYDNGPGAPGWSPTPAQRYALPPSQHQPGPTPEISVPPAPGPGPMSARPLHDHREAQVPGTDKSFETTSQVKLVNVSSELPQSGIVVYVPETAKLFVNGHQMKSKGEVRRFVANHLQRGKSYSYNLRAEMVRNGKRLVRTEHVELKAGRVEEVGFDFADTVALPQKVASTNPNTQLTVVVPNDAVVFLDGVDTISVGSVRRFETNDIAAGKSWNDYVIRVELERDGKKIVKTQKINLQAGEKQEVEFDLGRQVASSK